MRVVEAVFVQPNPLVAVTVYVPAPKFPKAAGEPLMFKPGGFKLNEIGFGEAVPEAKMEPVFCPKHKILEDTKANVGNGFTVTVIVSLKGAQLP